MTLVLTRPNAKQDKEIYSQIDFSYLQGAVQVTYDIESLRELFTLAMINDHSMSIILFGDEQFDDMTEEDVQKQIRAFINKPDTLRYMRKQSPDEIESYVYKFNVGNEEHMKEFESLLRKMVTCKALPHDEAHANKFKFAEYRGWNSARYDLPLMVLTMLAIKRLGAEMTPSKIRDLSNLLIRFNDKPYKFAEYIEEQTKGLISAKEYSYRLNLAIWSDGHIDWAKIAKSDELDETDKLLPPALKKEMARDGMDIIIDESVAVDEARIWTQEDKDTLVDYNFNDVLGTRVKSEDPYLNTRLYTRDMIRNMYPYTSARALDASKLTRYGPSERDATAANLAGLVLIGPKRIKAVDYDGVDYTFPVPNPNKPGEMMWVDLWEFIKSKEEFIPDDLDKFFSHFRNKDTRSHKDNNAVKFSQPVTKSSTMNIPYYKDGNPTDTCCTVSMGGAHGFIMSGLRNMSPTQIAAWTRAGGPAAQTDKPTVDIKNAIHVDWSSFYPTMASKMQMYLTTEGYDRYTNIINYRIQLKQSIPYDKNDWTPDDYDKADKQEGLKFVLNNATGAANTHNPYALLPLDNKTLSMRLIGNMFIWTLAQRLTQAGAFIIATNTDGLFLCNIEMEKCEELINDYVKTYGMGVEPEPLSRFVNRDTSNRMEFVNGHRQKVGGRLRHAHKLEFTSMSLGQNIAYPLIAANAAIEYISQDEDWLTKPYDRQRLVDYITQISQEDHPEAWYHVYIGSSKRQLMVDGQRQQRINRVVLTKDGKELGINTLKAFKQAEYYEFIQQMQAGLEIEDMMIAGQPIQVAGYLSTVKTLQDEQFAFVSRTETRQEGVVYEKIIDVPEFTSYEEYSEFMKTYKLKYLGIYNPKTEKYEPVEKWTYSEKLTGYTSNRGITLNTAKELSEFDVSTLDLDAYVKWAETLLQGWKITNDIPAIGLTKCDDTVVEKAKPKTKVTKKSKAIDTIYSLYVLEITEGDDTE